MYVFLYFHRMISFIYSCTFCFLAGAWWSKKPIKKFRETRVEKFVTLGSMLQKLTLYVSVRLQILKNIRKKIAKLRYFHGFQQEYTWVSSYILQGNFVFEKQVPSSFYLFFGQFCNSVVQSLPFWRSF